MLHIICPPKCLRQSIDLQVKLEQRHMNNLRYVRAVGNYVLHRGYHGQVHCVLRAFPTIVPLK